MSKQLTITQHDIANTLTSQFDHITLEDAKMFIKNAFGSTATDADTVAAYKSIKG